MSNGLKAALLCNNKMAMPAMLSLKDKGVLCSMATADNNVDVILAFDSLAAQHNVPYVKINSTDKWQQLEQWLDESNPDIVLVMTFPWRIPQRLLEKPKFGFINFHYGLLPEMRGADPVFETVLQRLPEAGVTVHTMDSQLDAGAILMRESINVFPEYTYGILCSQLARVGNDMCIKLIGQLEAGNMPAAQQQDESKARYWPKRNKDELIIDWQNMSATEIRNIVNACNPIARGVPVRLNGWEFGLYDTSDVALQGELTGVAPGTIIALDPQNGLIVACKEGKAIKIDVIHTAEGVFGGYKLMMWGIGVGMQFS